MIGSNERLIRLDLHWNLIRSLGACEIFRNLQENVCLRQLDMSWNAMGRDETSETVLALSEALKLNTGLQHVDFSYNYFTSAEC